MGVCLLVEAVMRNHTENCFLIPCLLQLGVAWSLTLHTIRRLPAYIVRLYQPKDCMKDQLPDYLELAT